MGRFDTELLGKPSHDSLIKLQEYELKLLEVIRKTISSRIKCDRDYAQGLLQVANTGGKIDPPAHNSPIYDAWQEVVRNISILGQAFKHHSERLQTSTMEKIQNLIKDKQQMKKSYTEHRDRLDNQLLKIIFTELERRRSNYLKIEQETSAAKKAYDIAVEKGKMPAIEKAQDKYKKCTMKLHQAHNDYVLQITEAVHHQHYYRTSLLPELLGNLNYMENEAGDALREIVHEFLTTTSPCTDEIVSSHREAENRVQSLNADNEYLGFIQMRASTLEDEAMIAFDSVGLLHGEAERLPDGELVLNTLSMQGIEHACNGFQEDLETIGEQLQQNREALQSLHEEIQQISDNLYNLSLLSKKLEYTNLKLKFVENEVAEKKLQEEHNITSSCLNSLGDQQPPIGLDLPALDNLSMTSDQKSPGVIKGGSHKFKNLFSLPKISLKIGNSEESAKKMFDLTKDVRDHGWFHGAIPRNEANVLLMSEGDFLLRESTNCPGDYVLSVFSEGKHRHFKAQCVENSYKFEKTEASSIVELVKIHYEQKMLITKNSGCVITKPVFKDKWQLSHADLELGDRLGNGNFGDVYRARLRTENTDVAVKTCRENVDARTREKFLEEARILKGYDHTNIVRLIGVCTEKQPVYIVMELVQGGDLVKYLKKCQQSLTVKQLMKMCMDACSGLNYLEEKKCIHRDVAARNCLVGDGGVVKITDFGMSREEEDGIYSVSGGMKQIPIKWTAPEAMNFGTYTHKSDVWSFGILVWEIFSHGKTPYPGQTNNQVRENLERGHRMSNPHNCPDRMYNEVMLLCWDGDPARRPKFSELIRTMKSIRV